VPTPAAAPITTQRSALNEKLRSLKGERFHTMDSDANALWEKIRPVGMFLSGGLFGLGWFVAADALCRAALVLHAPVSPTYALPGVFASLALLLIVAVRRADLSSGGDGGMYDDGAGARARCALFLGYALSFGAVSSSVVALVMARQGSGGAGSGGGGSGGGSGPAAGSADLWMPAAIVIQTAAIAAAAMMAFVSHGGDDDGDGWGGYRGF
jgi:hypothetical protein